MGGRGATSRGGLGGSDTSGGTPRTKSEFGQRRDAVKSEIRSAFKDKSYNKYITDENGSRVRIEIGTNKESRKHLAHDIVDNEALSYRDASRLVNMLQNSTFVRREGLRHPREDYHHFLYFKAQGRNLYFNVGEGTTQSGQKYYRLYSLTEQI